MGLGNGRAGAAMAAGVILAMSAPTAFAGDGWVSEVKLGVLAHDIGFLGTHVENGADINGEVRFHSIDWFTDKSNPIWLNDLLSPRPDAGLSINTDGNTDFYYVGLVWSTHFARDIFQSQDSLFGDIGLGGAIQDGYTDNAPPGRKDFGSRALFHLSGELGYQFDPQWSLSVYYDHYSNADLANSNPGINDLGMRVGYKF